MAETLKTEQTLLTGSIPAIAGIEDPSQARMILYQAGRPVHAPMDNVGLATDTDLSTLTTDIQAGLTAQTRNRIVNGAMQHSQELGDTTQGISSGAPTQWIADQFAVGMPPSGTYTFGGTHVASTTPNGSTYRLRVAVTTLKASLVAADYTYIYHTIEGSKVADFQWGTASAKQVVLRFGWRSPAGTWCVSLRNPTGTRTYCINFTISAGQANTDTEQVFVIPGDVTGTWPRTATLWAYLQWPLGAGTNWNAGVDRTWTANAQMGTPQLSNGMASTSNVFELFDVSLHLDPLATGIAPPWVMPDEAEELRACQRYYWSETGVIINGYMSAGGQIYEWIKYPVTMRSNPAITFASISYSNASALSNNQSRQSGFQYSCIVTAAGSAWAISTIAVNARM